MPHSFQLLIVSLHFLMIAGIGCQPNGGPSSRTDNPQPPSAPYSARVTEVFPYDVNRPDEQRALPHDLEEISGLSLSRKAGEEGVLYAVQDEDGKIFRISGEQITDFTFRKDGDYEGIESVGDTLYVIKSSGTVYAVTGLGTEEQLRDDYNDHLNGDFDVEGLGYWPEGGCLLLCCKAADPDGDPDLRQVYRFHLADKRLDEKPYFTIDRNEVAAKMARLSEEGHPDFHAFFHKDGKSTDDVKFGPSGIAVHPQTGHCYVLSARGNLILVVDKEGRLLHLEKLRKPLHAQPEGIAFSAEGRLYISNEADGGTANILEFAPKPLGDGK